MKEKRYRICTLDRDHTSIYLEMSDLSETAVQIWQDKTGQKKTFVRIKMEKAELEKIIDEYKRIQTLQKTNK